MRYTRAAVPTSHRPAALSRGLRFLVVFLVLCVGAAADTVVLKNGRSLQGRVTEDGERITIETEYGTIRLQRSQVEKIIKQRTALDEYAERVGALAARAEAERLAPAARAQLYVELADWCEQNGLVRARLESLRKAVAADPDCAAAREALGFVRAGNAWVAGDKRLEALGLVPYQDRWVTPQAREDAERAATEDRQREQERAAAEAEQRRKQAEADKIEAERRLLEMLARREEEDRARRQYEQRQMELERARALRAYPLYLPYYVYWPGWPTPPASTPLTPAPAKTTTPATPPPTAPRTTSPNMHNSGSGPSIPLLP